jgi:hypothetical protein
MRQPRAGPPTSHRPPLTVFLVVAMPGLEFTPEEVTWLEAAVECHGAVAAQALYTRVLASLIGLSPLTEQRLAAWREEWSNQLAADRTALLDREAAAREHLEAAGKRPGFDVLENIFARAAKGEVL